MKSLIIIVTLAFVVGCTSVNTVRVLDGDGNAVPDANVTYLELTKIAHSTPGAGVTDSNGEFKYRGSRSEVVSIHVCKGELTGGGQFSPPDITVVIKQGSCKCGQK